MEMKESLENGNAQRKPETLINVELSDFESSYLVRIKFVRISLFELITVQFSNQQK
jgi:hypothetical protein